MTVILRPTNTFPYQRWILVWHLHGLPLHNCPHPLRTQPPQLQSSNLALIQSQRAWNALAYVSSVRTKRRASPSLTAGTSFMSCSSIFQLTGLIVATSPCVAHALILFFRVPENARCVARGSLRRLDCLGYLRHRLVYRVDTFHCTLSVLGYLMVRTNADVTS